MLFERSSQISYMATLLSCREYISHTRGYVRLDMWFALYEYVSLNAGRVALVSFLLPETLIQMGQDPNKHSGGAARQSV